MHMNLKRLAMAMGVGIGAIATLLWVLGSTGTPVAAGPAPSVPSVPKASAIEKSAESPLSDATPLHYVAITGTDSGDCSTPVSVCLTIQYAVDQAGEGDEIRVAAGTYTDIYARAGVTQVVYINKTVTIRGGYTTINWSTSNPISYPTTLDGQGQGRVLYITGDISPTIEGLRIIGGDANGLGGCSGYGYDAGGGVYVITATATISNNVVFSNTACLGGGLHLEDSDTTLSGNTVYSNTADDRSGGGLFLYNSDATLSDNTISSNTAEGYGGGLVLYESNATLSDNTIFFNTANNYDGGGLYLQDSDATLSDNTIFFNTADEIGGGLYLEGGVVMLSGNTVYSNTAYHGGGLFLDGVVTLSDNTIFSNTANGYGGGLWLYNVVTLSGNTIFSNTANYGGGLWLDESDATISDNTISFNIANHSGGGLYLADLYEGNATISGNTISFNTANYDGGGLYGGYGGGGLYDIVLTGNTISSNSADGSGGGLYLEGGDVILTGNTVTSNTAKGSGGGGLLLHHATLVNNIVADNALLESGGHGSGLCVSSAQLRHNTIARNHGGDGSGVFVSGGTVALTNTILVNHTIGITIATGSTVWLESTLWNGNDTNWGGGGTINHSNDYTGDPAFVDPDAGDYHIGLTSAAIDKGIDAGVEDDIDGDARPHGSGYDLGADEVRIVALAVTKQSDLNPVLVGAQLTYTIRVTNTGNVTLTATITDLLPNHVTPTGFITWTPTITSPGGVWTGEVVVTVEMSHKGPLTNVVRVTTEEGATGVYTSTTTLAHAPGVIMAPDQTSSADPGAIITYTHTLTNTGNVPDAFILTHRNDQDWSVTYDTPISVGYNHTATVVVSVTVPTDAISGTVDSTVITATSQASSTVQAAVTDTTTVNRVLGIELAPDHTGNGDPDTIVTYIHILTNAGNDPDIFDLTHHSSQDWTVEYDTPVSVSYHQTATVLVSITVPAGIISDTLDSTIITATSQTSTTIQAAVTDTTVVNHVPSVELAPDRIGIGDPDTIVTYTHTLTNSSNGFDVFDLTHQSSQDWSVTYDTPVGVGYNQIATVLISITIPAGIVSGTVDNTIITATSQADAGVYATVADTTTVSHVPSVALAPDRTGLTNPGSLITYTHILINAGNGLDTFNLTHKSSQGWTVKYVTPVSVGYNQTATVVVSVTASAGSSGLTDITVFTATSQADASVHATVADTTTVNTKPIADAGPDRFVVPSDAVLLDGSGSTDLDGHLPLTYRWKRTGGPFVILVGADTAQAAFQAPPYQGVLTFTLTVTDALGLGSSPDTVVVVYVGISPPANQPPYTPSNPEPCNGATNVPLTQTLSWQGGDPDGDPVTYTIAISASDLPLVVATTTLTRYTSTLITDTTYYWGITASDGISTSIGPTWRFTTVGFKCIYLPLVLRQ